MTDEKTIDFLPIPLVQGKWVQQRDFTLKNMQDYAQAHVEADRAQRQAEPLFAGLIAQHPGLAEELASAPMPDQLPLTVAHQANYVQREMLAEQAAEIADLKESRDAAVKLASDRLDQMRHERQQTLLARDAAMRQSAEIALELSSEIAALRLAVDTVCEGWTLPHDARKVLESALWSASTTAIINDIGN